MSRGLNKVTIIGHLGRDPEMRYTGAGKPVTTFTVAVSRSWNSGDGERHSETEWFNIVAWWRRLRPSRVAAAVRLKPVSSRGLVGRQRPAAGASPARRRCQKQP